MGRRHNYHKGRAAIRHYANQTSSSRFQPGEGPSRGLLCDYKPSEGPSEGPSFQALVVVWCVYLQYGYLGQG